MNIFYRMSESDGNDECLIELYDFSLIQFVHRGKKRKIEQIDIVPTKWLKYEKSRSRCVTPFLDSPYSEEDAQLLHDLVKNLCDPPESWGIFSIDIKGRASKFENKLLIR